MDLISFYLLWFYDSGTLKPLVKFFDDLWLFLDFWIICFSLSTCCRSLSDLRGFDFRMLIGSWCSSFFAWSFFSFFPKMELLFRSFLTTGWFLDSNVKISKFSSSRKRLFFFKLWLRTFSCFLIGFDLRSIFCKTTCIKLAWHLVKSFILSTALRLSSPPCRVGGLKPWTILSVFWFFLFCKCLWTILG